MKRVALVVAYDGTNYCGWQKQPNGITIEEVVNKCLSELVGEDIEIIGASRTDSGVHALGNVAVFDTNSRIEAYKFAPALNVRLPEDIRIVKSFETEPDFHPRYDKNSKTYEYKILNTAVNMPINRLYTDFVYNKLNLDEMKQAAEYILGEHDFICFCSAGSQVQDTVRIIYSLDIEKGNDNVITIRVKGNGFLYNMIRIIAGTLIEVGKGRFKPEYVKQIIESKDRKNAGPTAPARGLTLVEIDYKG